MLSPLVQLICVPVPSFVGLTRGIPNGEPTLRTFAELSGQFWKGVARPLFSPIRRSRPRSGCG